MSKINPYTQGIANFVANLTYDRIPAEVRHRNKLLMLDSLGCALYGADLPWSQLLQQQLSQIDSTRTCSVWGTPLKLSAPHAALVNGTQVQGFELDDVHKIYRSGDMEVHAVRGVSLKIQTGEFVALMGSSGSGKAQSRPS
jgi:2-methylcitrate dehydratase PrpD